MYIYCWGLKIDSLKHNKNILKKCADTEVAVNHAGLSISAASSAVRPCDIKKIIMFDVPDRGITIETPLEVDFSRLWIPVLGDTEWVVFKVRSHSVGLYIIYKYIQNF